MSRGKNWTQEEDTFLREHFPEMSDTELAEALGRNPHSVEQRRSRLGIKNTRSWTAEELEYLERRWGVSTVPSIAEKLNRSVNAVKLKAVRIGLPGNPINASELVTFNALINAMGMAGSATWFKDRWKRFGCPIQHRRFHNMRVAMIRIEAFWKWAEQHQDIMDFSRFEAYSLGAEPDWVQEKRRAGLGAGKASAGCTQQDKQIRMDASRG